jgi:hypothetical protein
MSWEWHAVEEEKALRALRKVIDCTSRKILDPATADEETMRALRQTREWVLKVFPDKEEAYDLIYKPRFERMLYTRKGAYERR